MKHKTRTVVVPIATLRPAFRRIRLLVSPPPFCTHGKPLSYWSCVTQ
jgi:hypothetical protein